MISREGRYIRIFVKINRWTWLEFELYLCLHNQEGANSIAFATSVSLINVFQKIENRPNPHTC